MKPRLLSSRLLSRRPGVAHAFTTREGGVSTGPLASLNLAVRPGEEQDHLRTNWSRVAEALGFTSADLALLSQVHGARVLHIDQPKGPLAVVGEADGAVTTRPGVLLAVRAADCVPILFAAPGGVAVAHAGWRGVVAGVVGATVTTLAEATGQPPATFAAAVGPHISAPAFEVGQEVVDALVAAGLDPARFLPPEAQPKLGKPRVDLGAAVEEQLQVAGVPAIELLGLCTQGDRFYSHRGDGPTTGRFAGLIALVRG